MNSAKPSSSPLSAPASTPASSSCEASHRAAGRTAARHTVKFTRRLLDWFDRHGRKSLPWQGNRDPYAIWVAEIMLQQTRVSTVIPYYRKFMARLPDIATLARCHPDELLHYWSGLGYYARARNLHAAAKKIVAQHHGIFPDRFDQVLALPGIGRSTAGAILAFACGQRHPILDGNVKRVLTRYYAIAGHPGTKETQSRLWQIADQLTPAKRVADYTQALMDLGATVCSRTKPRCADCPLASDCQAFCRGDPTSFPQAKPKTARPRKSVVMLLVKNHRAEWLLVKRPPSGIWGGLWSLPECADGLALMQKQPAAPRRTDNQPMKKRPIETWFEQQFGFAIDTAEPLPPVKHSFTHFDLDILPLPATLAPTATQTGNQVMDVGQHLWYNPHLPAARIGLPAAVNRILDELNEP